MPRPRRYRFLAACLVLLWAVPAKCQTLPSLWQNWIKQLGYVGYGVTQGSATVTSVSYCENVVVPVFGTCFNSDPGDPYVVPLLPVGSGYVDPYFGGAASMTLPSGVVAAQDFRLSGQEAALVLVKLPPRAAYFSYQGYVFSRLSSDYKASRLAGSPDPTRSVLYASYNNSINNTDTHNQANLNFGAGWVAFITTANSALSADMAKQFKAVGGNSAWLFPDPVGPNVNYGLSANSDDFSVLIRYLVPKDAASGTAWLNDVTDNVVTYRIDQPTTLAVQAYGAQTLLDRSYNTDETSYQSSLTELSQIMENWLTTQEPTTSVRIKAAMPTMTASSTGVPLSGSVGPICITGGTLCNGDEQDAIHWAAAIGKVKSGYLFVLDGVNPTTTNDATSLSISIEDSTLKTGVVTLDQTNPQAAGFSTGTLTGSVQNMLQTLGLWSQASPQLQANAHYLFAQIVMRGCSATQTYCGDAFTTVIGASEIPLQDGITAFLRAYALPGYTGGPNPVFVVAPNAVY